MNVIEANRIHLQQLKEQIHLLQDDMYIQALPILHRVSIGQHVRHIIEFFTCLEEQWESGVIDYDARKRVQDLEQSRELVLLRLDEILSFIQHVQLTQPITLISRFSTEDESAWGTPSTLARELVYALEHSIHHLAIIRIGLEQSFPSCTIVKDLGIAPATIRFRNQSCAL